VLVRWLSESEMGATGSSGSLARTADRTTGQSHAALPVEECHVNDGVATLFGPVFIVWPGSSLSEKSRSVEPAFLIWFGPETQFFEVAHAA
jgi:hypothetical protein